MNLQTTAGTQMTQLGSRPHPYSKTYQPLEGQTITRPITGMQVTMVFTYFEQCTQLYLAWSSCS